MRAQENSPITLTTTAANEKTNNNNSNSNNSICTQATCPNKGKIQTLRQRKSELEKLLDEKNLLLQQIQRQEAQIIGNECLSSSTGSSSGFHNDNHQYISQQQQNTSTLRRKVGSSFKLPRINKKETNAEIENLLLEKKLQQEICNASYKLANDLTLSKSVRRNQKAEYEAAQQKLSVINQNLSVLKKRQLRSHSTSFSEGSPTHITPNNNSSINTLIGGVGGNVCIQSSLNLKSPPQPSSQQSLISGGVLTTNLGNNFNTNSNNTECSILMSSKKNQHNLNITNTINSGYILNSNVAGGVKSNSNNSNTSRYNTSNNYSPNDRRNSIKSAILSSSSSSSTTKHENSSSSISSSGGLIQHFDRTLKNHRSDYDINRIVPSSTSHHQIDKYQFVNGLNVDNRISGSYSIGMRGEKDINYTNTSNYCNTFPLQQLNHQRIHHDNFIIDSDSKQQQQQQQQQHHHHQQQQQQIVTENNNDDCENEFEIINNHNRTSGTFEKSSPLLSSPHQKDGRFNGQQQQQQKQQQQQQQQQQLQYPIYDNESTTNLNYLPYSSRNSAITLVNEYLPTNTSSIGGFNDWKQQNKRYENFDTVSLYPTVSSTNQQQQAGLGGFWRTLPNNERVWHSTADDNLNIRKLTLPTTPLQSKTQQILPPSCISDDILTTAQLAKDEISDKISISSMNSETNKKSREKQWLETSLDTPIAQPKHSTTLGNQQQQPQQQDQEQRISSHHLQYIPPHHHHHHHHHGGDGNNSIFYPPLPPPQPSVSSSLTLPLSMSSSATTGQCNLNTISNYNKILNNNNNYKERSKLSSQSMSNKIYQRSTIQQRLEDQSRLSHSTSVLNKQYIDGHHLHNHQQQKKQLENQNVNTTTIPTIIMSPSHDTNILYYHNNEIYNETSQQIRQTQLSSQPNFLHYHHHHHHHQSPPPPPPPLPINSNKGTINSTNESSSSYYPSPPSPHHHHHHHQNTNNTNNNNNNNNNLYRNIGAASVLMSNMSKAQDIRVESPKNMTVIQKAVFVPYKEVTKPFEMSDFYKYSTKFRQKDQQQQQQQQQNNTIPSSSTMQLQSQQQQFSSSTNANLIHANSNNNNNNNNNNNSNNCDTRNTTVNVVEEVK